MKQFFNHLWSHIIKWNEYITIPIALLLWYLSPYLIHLVDSTAATYDTGIFQIILFAIIQLLIFNGIVWLIIRWTFPGIYKFLDEALENKILNNGSISQWEKCKIVLWVFSIYFIAIVLLSRVIS